MKRFLIAIAAGALLLAPAALSAADAPAKGGEAPAKTTAPPASPAPAPEHQFFTPADIAWKDAPSSLPKGAKVAVLEGDLAAPGPFTMRIWLPAGYKIPPHSHPGIEHVTVLSGSFFMGVGDTWDESKAHELTAASFSFMPAGMKHFAWAKSETVAQVHGMGPWGITYVNPSDDPRNQKQATK